MRFLNFSYTTQTQAQETKNIEEKEVSAILKVTFEAMTQLKARQQNDVDSLKRREADGWRGRFLSREII